MFSKPTSNERIAHQFLQFCVNSNEENVEFSPAVIATAKQFIYRIKGKSQIATITSCYITALDFYKHPFTKIGVTLDRVTAQIMHDTIICYLWIYFQDESILRNMIK